MKYDSEQPATSINGVVRSNYYRLAEATKKAPDGIQEIVRGALGFPRLVVNAMYEDYERDLNEFKEACNNLPILSRPPHPDSIMESLDPFFAQLCKEQGLFSSVLNEEYNLGNQRLAEARRTFTSSPFATYDDLMVSFHLFAESKKNADGPLIPVDYYWALTSYDPRIGPLPLLKNPKDGMDLQRSKDFYKDVQEWRRFFPEEGRAPLISAFSGQTKRLALLQPARNFDFGK